MSRSDRLERSTRSTREDVALARRLRDGRHAAAHHDREDDAGALADAADDYRGAHVDTTKNRSGVARVGLRQQGQDPQLPGPEEGRGDSQAGC